jgi:hypothetical protein
LQLADGSWWTLGQSYERLPGNDWSGMGRQTALYQVIWEGDRPWGVAPTTAPLLRPDLPGSGKWRSVHADDFNTESLGNWWHFLTKKAFGQYSLSQRKGWLRLSPDSLRAHIVQKETDHYYSAVTRVDFNATDTSSKAGFYLTNGNQREVVKLYSGYDNGKKIIFRFDTAVRILTNSFGNTVWLKLERKEHDLTAYYSSDGKKWMQMGPSISSVKLDKEQPNWNSWVGTSIGLFAEGKPADFDFFICKDGFSSLPAAGCSNYFGIQTVKEKSEKVVTTTSANGGWFMLSGVELGEGKNAAAKIEVEASAKTGDKLEIWLDDLTTGKLIATIPVDATEGNWKTFSKAIKNVSGHHDVFVKFVKGADHNLLIKSIRFSK